MDFRLLLRLGNEEIYDADKLWVRLHIVLNTHDQNCKHANNINIPWEADMHIVKVVSL